MYVSKEEKLFYMFYGWNHEQYSKWKAEYEEEKRQREDRKRKYRERGYNSFKSWLSL